MRRGRLPLSALALWAKLNNIELHGATVVDHHDGRGSRVVASTTLRGHGHRLMTIPRELSLSRDLVWQYAKVDRHLREVLEAFGDFALHARGAILIFLLLQMTASSPDIPLKIGASTPWSEYFQFLPVPKDLPVFWTDEERETLAGTTLQSATNAKLSSLSREFEKLREVTLSIAWCATYWWDAEHGCLGLDDWKTVDAMYRSRAMELPVIGHCMVPVLDMCNHDSDPLGHYNVDDDGNGVLLLDSHREISPGSEITICYGDKKGACEMLFSYGFLEESMKNAKSMFLPFDIPDDDPLKYAKQSVFHGVSGFRIYDAGQIKWASSYVWLACVNEEDGLGFDFAQTNDGQKELQVTWKGTTLENPDQLGRLLTHGLMWDVFRLRATSLIHQHVEAEINRRLGIPEGSNINDGDMEPALEALSEAEGTENPSQRSTTVPEDFSRSAAHHESPATESGDVALDPGTTDPFDDETGLVADFSHSRLAPMTENHGQEIQRSQAVHAVVRNGKRIKVESAAEDVVTEPLAVQDGQPSGGIANTSDNRREGSSGLLASEGNDATMETPRAPSVSDAQAFKPNGTHQRIDHHRSTGLAERRYMSRQPTPIRPSASSTICYIQQLKRLELGLLRQAREELTQTISDLAAGNNVQRYLAGDERYFEEPDTMERSSTPFAPAGERPSSPMEEPTSWETRGVEDMEGSTESVRQHRWRVQADEAWEPDEYW